MPQRGAQVQLSRYILSAARAWCHEVGHKMSYCLHSLFLMFISDQSVVILLINRIGIEWWNINTFSRRVVSPSVTLSGHWQSCSSVGPCVLVHKAELSVVYQLDQILGNNLFGEQGNRKRRCWYMHFKSSLVPHPEGTIVYQNIKY